MYFLLTLVSFLVVILIVEFLVMQSTTSPSAPQACYSPSKSTVNQANPEFLRLGRLENLMRENKISICSAQELVGLSKFDIAFICDDSGSMSRPASSHPSVLCTPHTRWDQLKNMVDSFVDIVTAIDTNGTEIHFLNRDSLSNITSKDDSRIKSAFAKSPSGVTPLRDKMLEVVQNHIDDKSLLLLIATDGIPTDKKGNPSLPEFKTALREITHGDHSQGKPVFVSILACTDNKDEIGWLNELDRKVENVDVNRTYLEERKEVLQKNPNKNFTESDYVAKALLPKFDKLDEQNMSRNQANCCNIS